MAFSDFPGNTEIKNLLKKLIREDRLSQSLLLSGDSLSFKDEMGFEIAKALHCEKGEGEACGECRNCKLMEGIEDESGEKIPSHPDFFYIEPQNNMIKIDTVREIASFIRSRPMISRKKVILIKDADRMNVESQNAFLKILEEPYFYVNYILTTSRIDTILDTIISRVQKIYLKRVSRDEFFGFYKDFPENLLSYFYEKGKIPSEDENEKIRKEMEIYEIVRNIVLKGDKKGILVLREYYYKLGKDERDEFQRIIIDNIKKSLMELYNKKAGENKLFNEKDFEIFNTLESIEGDLSLNINRELSFAALSELMLHI